MRKHTIVAILTILCVLTCFGCNSSEAFLDESSVLTSTAPDDSGVPTITNPDSPSDTAPIADNSSSISASEPESEPEPQYITLGFSGDINFDENWPTMQKYATCTAGLSDCIDPALTDLTNSFTLFMTNNEFTYSNRGTPMNGKMYTFRANPERVFLLQEMGCDLVLLANNHIFDYGEDAFYDTLSVLDDAGIDRIGAGRNAEEASRILYYEYGDITVAYTAATQAEKNIMTPEAGEDSPGVVRCYDAEAYLLTIKEAAENSDFVVANIHWGTEYSFDATKTQVHLAHEMIDAGADTVIGTHPHVLQGIEYYNDKPIFYSLGNYWFNEKELYSCLVELSIDTTSGELVSERFYPCIQADCTTYPAEGDKRTEVLSFMEELSPTVVIDDDGFLSPAIQ